MSSVRCVFCSQGLIRWIVGRESHRLLQSHSYLFPCTNKDPVSFLKGKFILSCRNQMGGELDVRSESSGAGGN